MYYLIKRYLIVQRHNFVPELVVLVSLQVLFAPPLVR